MVKRIFIIGLLCTLSFSLWGKAYTVVIDAGHGGKDGGAVGCAYNTKEKNLNLDVALRLAAMIRSQYPKINVLLTRDADVFIPLQGRADFANKANADLFISIHTNSAEVRSARGAETFILGTDRMDKNLDVAMRENAVMKLEKDYQTTYQGFNPNSVDSYIMFELMQNQYMDQSLQFASLVQTQFSKAIQRDDRGVRQAAFWVLLKTACPSVLVEMGFISNKEEEKYLSGDMGKRQVAEAIFSAFCKYYNTISREPEKVQIPSPAAPEMPAVKESTPQPAASVADVPKTFYAVQLLASSQKLLESDAAFKGKRPILVRSVNGLFKYSYGTCTTREEAVQLRATLLEQFPGCFVVEITQ